MKEAAPLAYDSPLMAVSSDYMYDLIDRVIRDVGPRAPCSPEEKKAAELMKSELEKYCDEVVMEEFHSYPKAFLGWIRIDVSLLIACFAVFLLAPVNPVLFSLLPLGMSGFAFIILYKQFLRYEEWTPKFLPYKKRVSQNVVGTFKPSGEVKRRVVFSGHIDSAFRFNLIQYTKAGYAYFFFGGVLLLFTCILVFLVQAVLSIAGISFTDPVSQGIGSFVSWVAFFQPLFVGVIILVGGKSKNLFYGAFRHINKTALVLILANTAYVIIAFLLLHGYFFASPSLVGATTLAVVLNVVPIFALFQFVSSKAIPGAIDNLTAVAVCSCIAKILGQWREHEPGKYPENTEVVIAIVGCEELGDRGSWAFGLRHAAEYNKIDTTCVNMESISDSSMLTIFNEEKTTGTKLTPEVYTLLARCAEELGINHNINHMPGVAGGTDMALVSPTPSPSFNCCNS